MNLIINKLITMHLSLYSLRFRLYLKIKQHFSLPKIKQDIYFSDIM